MLNLAGKTRRSMSLQQNQLGKIGKFMSLQPNQNGRKGKSMNLLQNQTRRKGRFASHQQNQLGKPTANRPRISIPRHLQHQRRSRRRGARRRRRRHPPPLLQVWTSRPQPYGERSCSSDPKPRASLGEVPSPKSIYPLLFSVVKIKQNFISFIIFPLCHELLNLLRVEGMKNFPLTHMFMCEIHTLEISIIHHPSIK